MTIDDVTEDVNGIKQLIAANCIRAAANLTFRCLTTYGQGFGRANQPTRHSPHSLQLWFTRFALLIKLGEYDLCKLEAEAFGVLERPDMFYEVKKKSALNGILFDKFVYIWRFITVLPGCL